MFTVILDANVLYGQYLRSFLVYVALTRVAVFRWTDRILDECFENLRRNREDLDPEGLAKTRQLMNAAIPEVLVTGYEMLEPSLQLPDPNDRHVLAAAIRCGAQAIVTFNRKDFPEEVLTQWEIEALSPDEFILDLLDLAPGRIVQALSNMQSTLKAPPLTIDELLDILSRDGLVRSAEALRERF